MPLRPRRTTTALSAALLRGVAAIGVAVACASPALAAEPPPPPRPSEVPARTAETPPRAPEAPPSSPEIVRLLRDAGALSAWLRQRGPDVAAASARVAQAHADVASARLLPNPVLDTSVSDLVVGSTNPPGLGVKDTAIFSIGVSETIELGKRGPRQDAASLRLEGAKRELDATLVDRIAVARAALGRVVYVRAKQAVVEDALAAARRGMEVERSRLDQGAISGTDYDRMELDRLALEADAARSRSEVVGALAACRAAIFAPCEGVGAALADLDASAPLPRATSADAIEKRPDVVALRLRSQAAQKERLLAERRAIPDPTLRLGYTHDRLVISGDQQNTLAVGVMLPLPFFDHGQADAARAAAHAQELDLTARAVVAGAVSDLDALLSRKGYLEEALDRLATTAVPKSAGVLDVTQRAFTQGQIGLTDLLLARRAHIALLVSAMDLRFEYFAVRSELRHVLGLDGPEPPKEAAP